MELNKEIFELLENFRDINSSIVIEEGSVIKSISEARNVLASSVLDVEFPQTFGIYDLREFLNVVRLVESPRLYFSDNYVMIADNTGRSSIKYFFTDTEMLTKAPEKFKMPEAEVSFSFTNEDFSRVKRAAQALGHTELAVQPSNGAIKLTVQDSENPTSNTFSMDVDGTYPEGEDFCFITNISNLKIQYNKNYKVEMSSKLISKYTSEEGQLEYFIALEKKSQYGA